MPMPVSRMQKCSKRWAGHRTIRRLDPFANLDPASDSPSFTLTVTSPCSVNLIALPRRL
jgi:hypothetical protein